MRAPPAADTVQLLREVMAGSIPVHIVSSYRTRALGFEKLAKQTRDADIRQRLIDLSRTCMAVADAIERHPELAEAEEFATRH